MDATLGICGHNGRMTGESVAPAAMWKIPCLWAVIGSSRDQSQPISSSCLKICSRAFSSSTTQDLAFPAQLKVRRFEQPGVDDGCRLDLLIRALYKDASHTCHAVGARPPVP
jgi:hypothetical protein